VWSNEFHRYIQGGQGRESLIGSTVSICRSIYCCLYLVAPTGVYDEEVMTTRNAIRRGWLYIYIYIYTQRQVRNRGALFLCRHDDSIQRSPCDLSYVLVPSV